MKAAPWILATVAAVVLVVSLVQRAEAVARADVHEERAATLAVALADVSAQNERRRRELVVLDSAHAVQAEAWAAERAALHAQADVARQRASEAARSLRASLDATGAALLDEYERQVEAERETFRGLLASAQAEVAQLSERVAARDRLIAGLYAEIDTHVAITGELRAANASLRNAVAPSFWTGMLDHWELVALGAGLGIVTWEIAR